jgi:hypothetical protein
MPRQHALQTREKVKALKQPIRELNIASFDVAGPDTYLGFAEHVIPPKIPMLKHHSMKS